MKNECDFLIIGGGIVGLSIARELQKRHHGARVIVLEKEERCGLHASGRNSGVLHAGFYYTADSLKARFSREGNRALTEYCLSRGLKINRCGKLVVARNEAEWADLDELMKRAEANGVELQSVDLKEAEAIEPRVRTCGRALFSPTSASVDPAEVMNRLAQDAEAEGVRIHTGVRYLNRSGNGVETSWGNYHFRFLVNCAGLYADTIARDFGCSRHYRILPFKGLYLLSREPAGSFRTHVYPVPDLRFPFLGVHLTVMADGGAKLGPTALPALWREQYRGMNHFQLSEFMEILLRQGGMFFSRDFNFRALAWQEIRKSSRRHLVNQASQLAGGIRGGHFRRWGRPGIRAQLVDIKRKKLEMDFVVEILENSLHILNAVSPAFTCAFPMADFICDQIEPLVGWQKYSR